jgi:Phage integrase family
VNAPGMSVRWGRRLDQCEAWRAWREGPRLTPPASWRGAVACRRKPAWTRRATLRVEHHISIPRPVKSDAGQRSIPIPRWLCEELAAGLAQRPGIQRDDPLILNKQGRAISRDTFRAKVVRPALRAAGLPENFRTYDIRHTHASLLIDDGANVLAVAQRMGHTDPSVTLRVYGHLFEGAQEELTQRLDRRRQTALGTRSTGGRGPGHRIMDLPDRRARGGRHV